ncbi:MAG: DUF6766 family protein, partial [Solirubrobacteraceae bacterium]
SSQALAGHALYNDEETAHARLLHQTPETLTLWRYVTSSSFGQAVMENWQSEYLQFTIFILTGVWFVQKGSTESKKLDAAGRESYGEQKVGPYAQEDSPKSAKAGRLRLWLLSNSLLIVMGVIWLGSWFGPVRDGLERLLRGPDPAPAADRGLVGLHHHRPTSGRRRCRTGNRSSSPSAAWRFSACTCASAGRRSPSRSARPTTRRPRRADAYSTVTVLARLRGWSTLRPRRRAIR